MLVRVIFEDMRVTVPGGDQGGLGAVLGAELQEDAPHVDPHRVVADVEAAPDLLVGQRLCQVTQDLPLHGGQRLDPAEVALLPVAFRHARAHLVALAQAQFLGRPDHEPVEGEARGVIEGLAQIRAHGDDGRIPVKHGRSRMTAAKDDHALHLGVMRAQTLGHHERATRFVVIDNRQHVGAADVHPKPVRDGTDRVAEGRIAGDDLDREPFLQNTHLAPRL